MLKAAARLSSFVAGAALAGLFALAGPAFAAGDGDISTPAYTNHPLPLYGGPGDRYDVRAMLPGGVKVHVDRCSGLWCRVHVGRNHGFLYLYALSFGQGPNSLSWPPEARHPGVSARPW